MAKLGAVADAVTSEEMRARVGSRIRALAQRHHLPLIHLADKAGVSRATLWSILAGRVAANTDTLVKLATALDIEPATLLRKPR